MTKEQINDGLEIVSKNSKVVKEALIEAIIESNLTGTLGHALRRISPNVNENLCTLGAIIQLGLEVGYQIGLKEGKASE